MIEERKQNICWAGFEFKVPNDWEIGRHSISLQQGSLVLFDRRRQRMEITWQTAKKEPDIKRSCEDLRTRCNENKNTGECSKIEEFHGWLGFFQQINELASVVYALKWQRKSGRVIQSTIVILDEPGTPKNPLVKNILTSCRDSVGKDKPIRWKAFGLDCRPPAGWCLKSTEINPMDVRLHFQKESQKGGINPECQATVQRLGMAGTWFSGDFQAYLQGQEPHRDFSFKQTDYRGHRAMTAEAEDETRLLFRLLKRSRARSELLWMCEPLNALFRVTSKGPPDKIVRPWDLKVECPSA